MVQFGIHFVREQIPNLVCEYIVYVNYITIACLYMHISLTINTHFIDYVKCPCNVLA